MRYVHTNIIAKDCQVLIAFYKKVFGLRSIGKTRDLKGEWVDRLTGLTDAHLVGEHLAMPGYDGELPTLEIFTYKSGSEKEGKGQQLASEKRINRLGLAHLAFEVEKVEETLERLLEEGGSVVGEQISTIYPDGKRAVFVYAADPEGNIIELQNWS